MLSRTKSFYLLLVGEAASGIGMWIFIIANLQFMSDLIPSDFHKSVILSLGIFASLFVLPFTGKWIDSGDKRKILWISSLIRCTSPLFMYLAIAFDSVAWMAIALIVTQTAGAIFYPTVRAAIPQLMDEDQLLKANTIFMNVVTVSRIAGTALGGWMAATFDLTALYTGTLVAYIYLLITSLLVTIPKSAAKVTNKTKEKMKFTEVFGLIRQYPAVLSGIICASAIGLFLGGFNLIVLQFGNMTNSPQVMGWIYSIEGTSILVASLFVKKILGKSNLNTASSIIMGVFAIAMLGISVTGSVPIVLISYGIFGSAVAFFFPLNTTVYQKTMPEQFHGRFFSFNEMLSRVLMQVSLLATGACLDLFGVSTYLIMMAVIMGSAGLFTYLSLRKEVAPQFR